MPVLSLFNLPSGDPPLDNIVIATDMDYTWNKSIPLEDLFMKQSAKNKMMSQLDPVKWPMLEDDSIIMVGIKKGDETKTCQTTLGDLKRHLLNEILEELKERREKKELFPSM